MMEATHAVGAERFLTVQRHRHMALGPLSSDRAVWSIGDPADAIPPLRKGACP